MSRGVDSRRLAAEDWPAWERLVSESPDGSVYALPAYLDALCSAAGGNFELLGVFRGEELVGGLPLYLRNGSGGTWVGPRLLLYYLGPVLRASETRYPSQRTSRQLDVLGAMTKALAERGLDAMTFKCRHTVADVRPFLAAGWKAWPSYSYLVPLEDLELAWSRVEQNLRRLVDRCDKAGFRLVEDDAFPTFYRLHRLALERKDTEPYLPESAFEAFFHRLRSAGLCRLFHAALPDGTIAASQLVLTGPHPVSHTVCAGADPQHLATGVNAFLRWSSFVALREGGSRANDLTDAALNPTTHFKSQLGGDLVQCMVLEGPSSRRWRLARLAATVEGTARSAARRLLRGGRAG